MFKKSILISLTVFFAMMIFTSSIKNKTRNIEKRVEKLQKEIFFLEKKLSDTQIDFVYLSSPEQLKKNLSISNKDNYLSFTRSRIFLSTDRFLEYVSKEAKYFKSQK
tara:strand:- start:2820 stop:3140 length:321 start_codon:yes stop_codon:yes gene_type:complete